MKTTEHVFLMARAYVLGGKCSSNMGECINRKTDGDKINLEKHEYNNKFVRKRSSSRPRQDRKTRRGYEMTDGNFVVLLSHVSCL